MTHRNIVASVILLVAAPILNAQEVPDSWIARAELLAHERLMGVRNDPAQALNAFTTDGCSGGMSATWRTLADLFPEFDELHMSHPPWESCCVMHDRSYHSAEDAKTAEDSFRARLTADETLRQCVRDTVETRRDSLRAEYGLSDARIDQAYDMIAASMFDAVRVGGGPCSGLPWRWGYGWPHCGLFMDLVKNSP